MTQFKDRQKAFEAKFQRDQEFQFRVKARRNRLLGLWAAEKIGLGGQDAEAYAKEVVASDFDEPGDNDVMRKVVDDLQGNGVSMDDTAIRKQMGILLETAKEQMAEEA